MIYIVIVVLILLVLLFVLFMLYVFFRKYQEAQALVRSLTDLEIQEFFDGKPELISGENNFEMIDFLPYKSEYEIPLDDLELGKIPICHKISKFRNQMHIPMKKENMSCPRGDWCAIS